MHAINRLRTSLSAVPGRVRRRHDGLSGKLIPRRGAAVAPRRGRAAESAAPLDAEACIDAIAARGDRAAFAALFTHFAPRVKTYLMGLGTPPAVAEDLAQDTLLAVWRKAATFDARRAGAATWIFTIARNLRIDTARRDLRRDARAEPLPPDEAAPPLAENLLLARESEAALHRALQILPAEQLLVVQLAFLRGLAHGEIEQVLGVPLGTVKSRLRLAMARLRAALADAP
jgi:RNA polymerase sigma-70 factor (ECF subfamily)